MKEVRVDHDTGTAQVIVPDYQLSLAIGKEGQNARLAAKLTGFRIDIKSETQAGDERRPRPAPAPVAESPAAEVEVTAPGDGSLPPSQEDDGGVHEPAGAEPGASASA